MANYTVVNSYGLLSVSSGGTANYTTLAQAGFLYVSSGGTANCTMFSSGGRLTVLSGGTADDTQINTFGFLLVSSGGKANRTTLSNSGFLYVSSGGMAESTTVNSGGIMWVYSSGTANSITVNDNGKLMISSGGTALTVVENGGYIMLDSGVIVEFASHTFSDKTIAYDATVHSGTTADRTIILSGGELAVYFGGTANGTQIEACGYLFVSSGGSANNTSVGFEGDFHVFDGGTGYNTFIEHGGDLYVSAGGTANGNDVEGRLTVYSGGTANSTNIKSNGHVEIFGTANETVLSGSAFLGYSEAGYGIATWALADVYSGGIANDTTIEEGQLVVLGKANRTTLYSGGGLYVSSGGTAFHTVVSDSIQCWHMGLQVYEGGTAFDTIVCSDGLCMVSGGFTEETVVNSCGLMVVCEMGNADSTTVNFGGEFYVYDVCNSSAPSENGASNTIINSGGAAYLFEFGRMVNTNVNDGGQLRIQDGVASNTTVYSGGSLHVYLDGKATNTTVCSGGKAFVSSGGVFDGTVLNGGIVTGWVDCKDITFSSGAILNIDISGLFGNSGALIRSFSSIEKETSITLTVSGRQANGTYVLADQALGDNRTITVINTTGVEIGTLVTGQTVKINGADYTLNTNNGPLVLQISNSETSSSITQNEKYGDVLLANPVPEAEYMYGCTPTAVGMLLGYYDLYGYGEKEFSNMIEGTVALKSRGTDGNAYDMNAFDTVLGRAIASKEYVYRFYSRDSIETTPAQELEYAFKSDNKTLNTDVWNCLADYLGTGQYWRGNENLSTRDIYGSLSALLNSDNNEIVISDGINTRTIDGKESAMLYGLDLYVKSRGYKLNASATGTYQVDVNGGHFTFARYMREIDEGRPVVITVEGHSMVGYGYNADTMEIIFDDTSASGQRMTWNSTYNYANQNRRLLAITVIALDESSGDSGPQKPIVSANITDLTNSDVLVSAVFDEDSSVKKEYSLDGVEWLDYIEAVRFTENGIIYFRVTDEAGNSAKTIYEVTNIDKTAPVITLTGDNQTPLQSSTLTAAVDDGSGIFYSLDQTIWTKYESPLTVTANATYYFKSTDAAGNEGTNFLAFANIIQATASDVAPQTQTWEQVEEATQYIVEYSTDNFEHVIQLVVDSNSLDSFQMPAGNYQMRVKADGDDEWTVAAPVTAEETSKDPKLIKSNADGHADVFFVNTVGTWESGYVAQHVGSTDDDTWSGTEEYASLFGKNKLTDIIEGSTDANVLLMTDDAIGDALFVDDIYSASPDELGLSQSRIAQIDEIRAGAGNDIIDMTSNRFEYTGDGLTIRGGDGNDTIWANKGNNMLFGDAGNDRIVGASGNDVIVGGIGKDSMHGGGGDDIFAFCDNWGIDTVEQLAGGKVTLWFASGDESKWNAEKLTYTDGDNSVTVTGVTSVTLKFGNDGSDAYKTLAAAGAFAEFTSQKIFEESRKGLLA